MKRVICVMIASFLCLGLVITTFAANQKSEEIENRSNNGDFEPGSRGAKSINLETGDDTIYLRKD